MMNLYSTLNDTLVLDNVQKPIENNFYIVEDSIFLKKKERFERVELSDILWAEAASNYTLIFTAQEKFLISYTLNHVSSQLEVPYFMRVHRSYLINLKRVTSFEGNTLYIKNNQIPVSKSYRDEVFKRFRTF